MVRVLTLTDDNLPLPYGYLGSFAASYQSTRYGGNTPSSSLFSYLQSTGAGYHVGFKVSRTYLVIRILAGLLAFYIILAKAFWW